MPEISKEQFAKGTAWKLIERFAGRGISLVVSMVLSRILTPDDYGLITLTTVFTNLSEILIDAGFGTALIRKKEIDDGDYSCVFVINCLSSLLLYTILFFSAPLISDYYEKPELIDILRVVSLVLFIQAFATTRNAYVNRNMQFKLAMKCNTVAAVISGVLGICFAYLGFGVWALVFQRLLQQMIITILLFIGVKWHPKFVFNKSKLKSLLGFSAGVVGASLLNYVENCVNSIIIGKHYSVADLGYYDKGNILPEQISLNSFGAMTNVLLPTVSSYQNNIEKLKEVIRKVLKYTSFLMFPIMFGMLMVSREAIVVFFTDKWLQSIPLMRFICIYYIATPLMLIDIQVFFGLGKSGLRVKTEIIRLLFIVTGVILCCFVFKAEIQYLAFANAIAACIGTISTHIGVRKLIGYTIFERIKDTYKSLISTVLMCIVLFAIIMTLNYFSFPIIMELVIEVLVGIIVYMTSSLLLKNEVLFEILKVIKTRSKRKTSG